MAAEFGNKIARRTVLKWVGATAAAAAASELLPHHTAEAQQAPLAEPLTPFSDLVESLATAKARNMYTTRVSVLLDGNGNPEALHALVAKRHPYLDLYDLTLNIANQSGDRLTSYVAAPQTPVYPFLSDAYDSVHLMLFGGIKKDMPFGGTGTEPTFAYTNDGNRYSILEIPKADLLDVNRGPIVLQAKFDDRFSVVHFGGQSSPSLALIDTHITQTNRTINPEANLLQETGVFTSLTPSRVTNATTPQLKTFYSLRSSTNPYNNTVHGLYIHTVNTATKEMTAVKPQLSTNITDIDLTSGKGIVDVRTNPTNPGTESLLVVGFGKYLIIDTNNFGQESWVLLSDLFSDVAFSADITNAKFTKSGDILISGSYIAKDTYDTYAYIAKIKANTNPSTSPNAVERLYQARQNDSFELAQYISSNNGEYILLNTIYGPGVFSLTEKQIYTLSKGLTNQATTPVYTSFISTAFNRRTQ